MREARRTTPGLAPARALLLAIETVLAWTPALLLLAPLALLALGAFAETWDSRGPRGFTLDAFAAAWTFSARSARLSLWIATLAAIIAVALAVPAAYLMARDDSRWSAVLRPALALPVVLPSLLLAMGLILAFPSLHGGWRLLLAAYVVHALPFAIWPIATSLQLLDLKTLETAGRTLGAGPLQRFAFVVLPNVVRPAAVGGMTVFVLVLAESSASFFLASGQYQPFGVTLYNAFQDLDIRVAAAATMLLIAMLAPPVLALELWLGRPARKARAPADDAAGARLATHLPASQ